jgi:citrate synthase
MEQLLEIGSPENVDDWFDHKVAAKDRIFGFGHRVYKAEDPRATILRQMAQDVAERTGHTQWFDMSARLEERVLAHPYFQERRIYANVDFYTAPLLWALDMPLDLFIPMFAIARIAGWTAHLLEQQRNNRLIRPRAYYAGPSDLHWIDIDEREPLVEAQPEAQCVAGRPANCPAALEVPPRFWPAE